MSILNVVNLNSGYQSKHIIHDASFELAEGEFCALLGLNGCGKSTLIKTIGGLIKPYSGTCILDGKDLSDYDEKERAKKIAYIPQRGSTINNRTVQDVVLMGFNPSMGVFENYSGKQIAAAGETMKRLGIEHFENLLYEELSEGQKQLVILARTLVQNTSVVLMDEPDSALDFANRIRILQKIKATVSMEKKIGLVALHDPNSALSFCDRILTMKDGRIVNSIRKEDYCDFEKTGKILSEIYGEIRLINDSGKPFVIKL